WSWELLQGDFNENPTVGQIITNAIITAIPVVDQVADVRDICACIKFLAWDKRYEDKAVWITVVFTVIGLVPTVGSLLKGVFKLIYKGAKLDELLEVFNFFKKGNGVAWLKELHGGKLKQHMQEAASIAHQIFDACTSKLIEVQAFLPRYLTDAHNNIVELLVNLEKTKAMINGKFAEIGDELVAKLGKILGESKPPKPASAKDKLSVQQSQTPPPKDNDYILLTSSNVTVLEPGKKGGWNKALNGKLKPNHKYQVGDYLYETDDLSRVHKVSGELKLGVRDRNTYQQTKSAKVDGIKDGLTEDDGGHLIASIFDGAGEQINYAPMNANLNRGAWKAMENKWARALNGDPPKTVKVDIQPIYPQSSTRPSKFIVEYEVDGEPFTEIFRNKSGGK
uniref:DNA/RNA non-specific endonuclease n=1 Tax=Vibrio atypicus TaxID=558271 RepID=UPI0037362D2C